MTFKYNGSYCVTAKNILFLRKSQELNAFLCGIINDSFDPLEQCRKMYKPITFSSGSPSFRSCMKPSYCWNFMRMANVSAVCCTTDLCN